MSSIRTGRRRYYDFFSSFYDAFIRLHARRDEEDTRSFLVDSAGLPTAGRPRVLDVCCGTGAVVLAFAAAYPQGLLLGYDFSHGMLLKARAKAAAARLRTSWVEGDAARLPFADRSFDVVTCSHALYELKGAARQRALAEMKRVLRDDGVVLLMEHEVPRHPLIRLLFYIRIYSMGSGDAREFIDGGTAFLEKLFPVVELRHSPSGKSKLFLCRRREPRP